MTDHRLAKESRRQDAREQRREHERKRAEGRDSGKPRKPSKIERREWRGAGVCGDRHTD
jgi:hypothetical protein